MTASVHDVTREEVMALHDGELPANRAAEVTRHVGECAICNELRQHIVATSAALAAWVVPEYQGTPEFEHRMFDLARYAAETRNAGLSSNLRRVFGLRPPLVWGAAAVAVLVFIMVVQSSRHYGLRVSTVKPLKEVPVGGFPVDLARTNNGDSLDGYLNGTIGGSVGKLQAKAAESQELEQTSTYDGSVQNGPMIARTVSLWIVAKDFGASPAALDAILLRHHGYAANLSVNAKPNAARSLQASLRVPAPELGAVLAELKALGRVQNETQNGEEVTQQHADLVARLKNSREEEMRLQDILRNRTGKIGDVLAVEQEIARVRGEIEQMEAEQKNLEHRVDFATVDVNLSEEYKAQLGTPAPSISTRFHNAVVKGIRGAQDTIVGILLFFAEAGPSFVLWAVLLLPAGWFFWRRWRRSYGLASSASL